jgi:predicted RNA-binding protein with TRAM domain
LYFQPTPSRTPFAAPQVLNKPDFAATDNVRNVFFFEPSGPVFRFAGTSAAAPQAAAIGALLRQHDPALSPVQVMATLRATAQVVPTNGTATDVGGGYLDANAALASVVPLPGAPRVISSVSGNARATLQWSAAPGSPTAPVLAYRVTPIRAGVAQPARAFNSKATSQVLTGLANGTSYRFTVTAINANGSGAASAASAAVVIGVPGAPTAVTATAGRRSATVHWKAPAANGKPITGYTVAVYIGSAAKSAHVFKSRATTQTIRSLTPGKHYTFRITARNARGAGAKSVASNAVTVT